MTAMTKNVSPYLQAIQDRYNWDMLQSRALSSDLLDEILRFHQRTTNIPYTLVQNNRVHPQLLQWIEAVTHTDTLPALPLERVQLNVTKCDFDSSAAQFDRTWSVELECLGSILYKAFGRGESLHKRYPSAGALYPVIPILCVFTSGLIKELEPGTFSFDPVQPALLRLTYWKDDDLHKLRSIASVSGEELPSDLAIGYVIDIRRAVTKYRYKGYRHALIEIGLMAQAFRESLREISAQLNVSLAERCWSGFADNALTSMSGLDVRLAPISLLQWFGKRADEVV